MSPSPGVDLRPEFLGFFATPAFVVTLSDADAINATLRDLVLEREGSDSGLDLSNVGGWHSPVDFIDWGGPALHRVLNAARSIADRYTCDRAGRPVKPEWHTECWVNINRLGHANKRHTHPGSLWSGTCYVDDGGADGPGNGGEFEFLDPRGATSASSAERWYALPAATADSAPLYRPKSGSMVMFPSWLPHAVRPYLGDAARISIAFNLALKSRT